MTTCTMPSIRAGGQLWRYLLLNEEPPSAAALRTQIRDTMPDWEPPACSSSSVGGEELVDGWHDTGDVVEIIMEQLKIALVKEEWTKVNRVTRVSDSYGQFL